MIVNKTEKLGIDSQYSGTNSEVKTQVTPTVENTNFWIETSCSNNWTNMTWRFKEKVIAGNK